jgi:hypothetical protein
VPCFSLLGVIAIALAAPPVKVVDQERAILTIHAPGVAGAAGSQPPAARITVPWAGTGQAELRLRWPSAEDSTTVRIDATSRPAPAAGAHVVRLEARVERPDGTSSRSAREIRVDAETTALFEVDRVGDRALTLVVAAEVERERSIAVGATVGAAVVFHLGVQGVQDGTTFPLESNRLSTFVGEPVSYSFQLGEAADGESLRVQLTPLGVHGDVIQVEIVVDGKLRDGPGLRLLSRREQWLGSRGESTHLDVVTGEPPAGFRFVVAPEF